MDGAIDISVVVPFHDARAYLERCVEGLLGQTYPRSRYEIILVDNNSRDGSAELVQAIPGVRVLHETKQGAYAARNRGVAASRGEILAFTDADCVADADWLSAIAAAMDVADVGLVQGSRTYGGSSRSLSLIEAYEFQRAAFVLGSGIVEIVFGYTNNMAVRRTLFSELGPFVEAARGADSLFVCRVMEARSPGAVRFVPEASIRHLELASVGQWLRKKTLYGRSSARVDSGGGRRRRDYTVAESHEIVRRTIAAMRLSPPRATYLVTLVWLGSWAFRLGRLSGRWTARTARVG